LTADSPGLHEEKMRGSDRVRLGAVETSPAGRVRTPDGTALRNA
jgi:hypothetical protein